MTSFSIIETRKFMFHNDGRVELEAEQAVSIPGIKHQIQLAGFGTDQSWRETLESYGGGEHIDTVAAALGHVRNGGGEK